jgi:hypothetical protein
MRFLITTLAVLSLSNAFAFDGAAVVKQYDHARPGCRQNELDGKPIGAAESARQCKILAKLGKELKANGYCWYKPQQEWRPCK